MSSKKMIYGLFSTPPFASNTEVFVFKSRGKNPTTQHSTTQRKTMRLDREAEILCPSQGFGFVLSPWAETWEAPRGSCFPNRGVAVFCTILQTELRLKRNHSGF